ncbi:MAG: hypothetical protein ACRYHQ_25015 [Janthinobacterium lividum]
MSDLLADQDDTEAAPPDTPIPNFSVTPKTVRVNGNDCEHLEVTYGEPKQTIEIEPPTLGDRFCIAGIAPDANDKWVGMALAAGAIRRIGEVPRPSGGFKSKVAIRGMLVRLGYDGLRAINRALSSTSGAVSAEPAEDEDAPPPPIPNFSASSSAITVGKKTLDSIKITFGEPVRTVEIVRPGLGEQFDLMEIGPDAGPLWTGLAIAAMSVHVLDGTIVDEQLSEAALARVLTKLGPMGVAAINQALAPAKATDAAAANPDGQGDEAETAFKGAVGN